MRYLMRGSHTYTTQLLINSGSEAVQMEAWEDTPPVIRRAGGTGQLLNVASGTGSIGGLFLKRIIAERDDIGIDGPSLRILDSGGANRRYLFENCTFIMKKTVGTSKSDFMQLFDFNFPSMATIKGCQFLSVGSVPVNSGLNLNAPDGNGHFDPVYIDNCYFEGPMNFAIFSIGPKPYFNGGFDYCGFFNLSGGIVYGTEEVDSVLALSYGGHNIGDGTGPSQLVGPKSVTAMTLPDDLRPKADSLLIGAGDPDLALFKDLFNSTRAFPPAIGSVEFVVVPPPPPPTPPGPPIPPRGRPAPIYNRPMRGRGGGSREVLDWPV